LVISYWWSFGPKSLSLTVSEMAVGKMRLVRLRLVRLAYR